MRPFWSADPLDTPVTATAPLWNQGIHSHFYPASAFFLTEAHPAAPVRGLGSQSVSCLCNPIAEELRCWQGLRGLAWGRGWSDETTSEISMSIALGVSQQIALPHGSGDSFPERQESQNQAFWNVPCGFPVHSPAVAPAAHPQNCVRSCSRGLKRPWEGLHLIHGECFHAGSLGKMAQWLLPQPCACGSSMGLARLH